MKEDVLYVIQCGIDHYQLYRKSSIEFQKALQLQKGSGALCQKICCFTTKYEFFKVL